MRLGNKLQFTKAQKKMALATCDKTDYEYLYKLLLIGDSGVGKSCLLTRFADSTFTESQTSTIGVDFKIRTIELDDKRVKLQIWDSAGQERFRTVSEAYYRGAHGIGIVFDVTSRKSFASIESSWVDEIWRNKCGDVPQVVIGTKCDLVDCRQVERKEAELFSRELGMEYIETSSKTAENVTEAFITIAREIYGHERERKRISASVGEKSIQVVELEPFAGDGEGTQRKGCC